MRDTESGPGSKGEEGNTMPGMLRPYFGEWGPSVACRYVPQGDEEPSCFRISPEVAPGSSCTCLKASAPVMLTLWQNTGDGLPPFSESPTRWTWGVSSVPWLYTLCLCVCGSVGPSKQGALICFLKIYLTSMFYILFYNLTLSFTIIFFSMRPHHWMTMSHFILANSPLRDM